MLRRALRLAPLLAVPVLTGACDALGRAGRGGEGNGAPPDSLPVLAIDSLPFRYPTALYIERVQDDVTLRLYVDEFGRPVPESTRVEEHAKNAAFDTSAMVGSRDLVFRPAYRDGKAIPYSVLFPIKYRVPNGPPQPGDSTSPDSGAGR